VVRGKADAKDESCRILAGLQSGTILASRYLMTMMPIIVSNCPRGNNFVSYLRLSGFFPELAPLSHKYSNIRGPFTLYLVNGTADQVRDAVEFHGQGGEFALTPVGSESEAPAAAVTF
jgi:hypothetical protein